MVNIAVLGYGTVGSGVVEVSTQTTKALINVQAGDQCQICSGSERFSGRSGTEKFSYMIMNRLSVIRK